MKVLVLGGTRFLGPAIVAEVLAREWDLTVAHSGRHPLRAASVGLREIRVPRADLADEVAGRSWDLVIDTQARRAHDVRQAEAMLGRGVGCYAFMSSANTYAGVNRERLGEADASPRAAARTADPKLRARALEKLAAEAEARRAFGAASLIFRLPYLVGPCDESGRLSYWSLRARSTGPVLRPEPSEAPLQFLDVRDASEFLCSCAGQGLGGIYNVAGPATPLTFSAFLARLFRDSPAELHGVDQDGLRRLGVSPEAIPFWEPERDGFGLARLDCARAFAAGLRLRDLGASLDSIPLEPRGPFLSRETEVDLLAEVGAWALTNSEDR